MTVDGFDWLLAEAYEEALARRDDGLRERVVAAYLSYLDTTFAYYEGQSRRQVVPDFIPALP